MAYMTAKEIQEHLKISASTLYRLRKEGLPHQKIGHKTIRYDLEEVENWLKEREGANR